MREGLKLKPSIARHAAEAEAEANAGASARGAARLESTQLRTRGSVLMRREENKCDVSVSDRVLSRVRATGVTRVEWRGLRREGEGGRGRGLGLIRKARRGGGGSCTKEKNKRLCVRVSK